MGLYYVGTNDGIPKHFPIAHIRGYLLCFDCHNAYKAQILFSADDQTLYLRYFSNGWVSWNKINVSQL